MKRSTGIIAFSFLLTSTILASTAIFGEDHENGTILRVHTFPAAEKAQEMHDKGFEIITLDRQAGTFDILVAHTHRRYLEKIGLDNVPFDIFEQLPRGSFKDPGYHSVDQLNDRLKALAQAHPNHVALHTIGYTKRKRPILAVKISDNVDRDEAEPTLMFDFQVHAREVMTAEVGLGLVEMLAEGYANADDDGDDDSDRIRQWVDAFEIWVIPSANPDGTDLVYNKNKMHRKNANYSGFYPPWMFTPGVDINRNFPVNWNTCKGSSSDKMSDAYRGAAAGSENETGAIIALAETIQPFFYLTMHAYGEMVILPYGCKGTKSPEDATMRQFAEGLAKTLPRQDEPGHYRVGQAFELLYAVDGDSMTHMAATYGTLALAMEVTDAGFHPSAKKWIKPTQEKMSRGFRYIFDRLSTGPVVTGRIIDAVSGELIDATLDTEVEWVREHGEKTVPHRIRNGHFYWYVESDRATTFRVTAPGYHQAQQTLEMGDNPQEIVIALQRKERR